VWFSFAAFDTAIVQLLPELIFTAATCDGDDGNNALDLRQLLDYSQCGKSPVINLKTSKEKNLNLLKHV
jgi:hypothetical protein